MENTEALWICTFKIEEMIITMVVLKDNKWGGKKWKIKNKEREWIEKYYSVEKEISDVICSNNLHIS